MKRINLSSFFLLLIALLLGYMLFFGKSWKQKEVHYSSSVIIDKLSAIEELATVKYNYTGVVSYRDAIKLFQVNVPLTEKSFIFKYNAYLKAGVDFTRIKVKVYDNSKVHVSLPRAEIFDIVIDENSVHVFNEIDNAFNPIKIGDYNKALIKEKATIRKDAIDNGLLKDANRQAELILKSFLKEMGFDEVDIMYEIIVPEIH